MDNALELTSVEKRYPGFALEDVAFSLPRGHIMGLIGANGAGKTTLIKLVLNLIRRDAGSIRVFGLDNLEHEVEVKARIGFVPDEPKFHEDIPLRDLVAATARFYPRWNDARFGELADAFELPLAKKFKKVSQGNRTKFALAIALSHGAELVLLDEPTSGLDPVFRSKLLDLLGDLLQDEAVSVLFSTHITADLERIADYITFLRDGRLVFSSPKDEVLDTWKVVRGGLDVLDSDSRPLLEGIREREHGFEGLTSRGEEVRRRLGDRVALERATLDDVMVLMRKESRNAA